MKWKTYWFFLPGVFYTTPGPPGATGDSSPRHIAGYWFFFVFVQITSNLLMVFCHLVEFL